MTVDVNSSAATSGTVTGLKDNTNYTLQVTARNVYGEGSPSAASNVALTLPGAPGTPNVQAGGGANSVVLTFSPPTDGDFASFTNFRAQVTGRAADAAVSAATACPGGASSTCSVTVGGLVSGTTYTIAVQAQNATGWGPLSAPATGVEITAPTISASVIRAVGAPAAGYVGLSAQYVVYANATDASGVASVTANVNNITSGTTAAALTNAGGPWTVGATTYTYSSAPLTSSGSLTAGSKSYSITATDIFANSATNSSFTVTADVAAPAVTLTKVGGVVQTFPYSVNAANFVSVGGACGSSVVSPPDNLTVTITVSGPSSPSGTVTCASSAWTYTFPAPITAEGSYSFTATQSDYAGNSGTSGTKVVNLDRSAPTGGAVTVNGTAASGAGTTSFNTTGAFPINSRTDYTDPISGMASSTLTRASGTLTNNVCGAFGATTVVSGTTAQSGLVTACYQFVLKGTDNAGNIASISTIVKVDTTGPTGGALTVNGTAASAGGSTSSNTTGAFPINARTDYTVDPATGVASSILTRAAGTLSGNVCGAFGATTVIPGTTAQSGLTDGCYQFVLTGTDNAGGTSSISTIVKVDTTPPTGGAVTVNGTAASGAGTTSSTSSSTVNINSRTDYTDAASGIASSTLTRATGTLTNNVCGAFGVTTVISGTTSQTGLTTGCYQFVLKGTDNAGNIASISTIVKVDTAAPTGGAVTVNGTAASGAGTTSFNGSGTVPINSRTDYTDAASGLASSTLTIASGTLTNNVCGSFGAPSVIVGTTTQSGLTTGCYQFVLTGTDNAGGTASISTIVKVDTSAPTGGALTVNGTAAAAVPTSSFTTSTSVTINSRTDYTDAASGIASSTLTRTTATLSGNTCGSFGSATVVAGTTTQSGLSTNCYQFTLVGTDNAGNTASVSTIVKVDTAAPTGGAVTVNGTAASGAGTTSFNGSGTVPINSRTDYTDAASGLASSTLTIASGTLTNNVCGSFGAPSVIVGTTTQSGLTTGCYQFVLTGTDNAGGTASISTIVKVDTSAPTGGAVTVNGTAAAAVPTTSFNTTGAFPINSRTDYTDAASGLASSTLTRAAATLTNNVCGAFGSTTVISGTTAQSGLATSCYQFVLTGTDNAGNAASVSTIVKVDTSAPTGGAVTVNGTAASGAGTTSTTSSGTVTINSRTDYTDAASGIASSTLTTATATLTNNTCGSFGAPTVIVGTTAQTGLTTNCYQFVLTGTDNAGNTASVSTIVKVDTTAPVVGGSVIATTTDTTIGGNIKQGGLYYVYANVTDVGTGVGTVTANVTNVTTGSSAVPLVSGVYNIGATSYNYRSASLTANAVLTAGSKTYTVTAADVAGNSSGATSWSTNVDNTVPTVPTAAIAASGATTPGFVGANVQYFVYANVADTGGAGIGSVTASTTNVTTGATSVPLVAGSYSVGVTTYNYRSAVLTSNAGLTAGSKPFTVTAVDWATNTSGAVSFNVTADITAPSVAITKVNAVTPGSWPYSLNANVTTVGGTCTTSASDSTIVNVTVTGADTESGTATCSSGAWTYTFSSAWTTDGSSTVNASQADFAGNVGNATARTITLDKTPPVISATVMAATTDTNIGGAVRQGGTYYVYANVTDATSTVSTVTANASNITTGQTAVAMVAGSYTVGGVSYNYRTASLTANASLTAGVKTYTVTATDSLTNSATTPNQNVTVDNTKPAPTNITLNNSATSGTAAAGDYVVITYSEGLDPDTLCTTWTGPGDQTTTASVSISTSDALTVGSPCANLGSIALGGNYNTGASTRTFPSSTIAWDESAHTITITLGGSPSGGTAGTGVSAAVPVYTPTTSISDPAGNTMNSSPAVNGTSSRF